MNLYEENLNADLYFKKTYELLTSLFDVDIQHEKNISGRGCFSLHPHLIENNQIFTGEAAGLQDILWGFGMRYAINSGYYAAQSIIENKDYEKLIREHLSGRLKTSIVNRYFSEKYKDWFYVYLINQAKKKKNWINLLQKQYNPSLRSIVTYPFALWKLSKKYKNSS